MISITYAVIFSIILIIVAVSHIIPSVEYDREGVVGRQVDVDGSYDAVACEVEESSN